MSNRCTCGFFFEWCDDVLRTHSDYKGPNKGKCPMCLCCEEGIVDEKMSIICSKCHKKSTMPPFCLWCRKLYEHSGFESKNWTDFTEGDYGKYRN